MYEEIEKLRIEQATMGNRSSAASAAFAAPYGEGVKYWQEFRTNDRVPVTVIADSADSELTWVRAMDGRRAPERLVKSHFIFDSQKHLAELSKK